MGAALGAAPGDGQAAGSSQWRGWGSGSGSRNGGAQWGQWGQAPWDGSGSGGDGAPGEPPHQVVVPKPVDFSGWSFEELLR